jgi:hypothetical protein
MHRKDPYRELNQNHESHLPGFFQCRNLMINLGTLFCLSSHVNECQTARRGFLNKIGDSPQKEKTKEE